MIAAPFYTLTKDIYVSFALANTLITLVVLFLIIRVMKQLGTTNKNAVMACNLILIPYSFGMLDYYNMLFFNGSQYVIRIIIILTLFSLILCDKERRLRPINIVLGVMEMALIVIAAIASGAYILLVCLLPMILVMVLNVLIQGRFGIYDKYQYIVCGVSLVLAVIGLVINHRLEVAMIGNSMSLLRWYDFRYYLGAVTEGYFQLFGAMPGAVEDESVAVLSVRGISFLIRMVISIVVIVTFVKSLKNIIFAGKDVADSETRVVDPRFYLYGMAFINFTIIMVCETRYNSTNNIMPNRYMLPAVIPVLMGIPIYLDEWKLKWSKYLENVVSMFIVAGIALVCIMGYKDAKDSIPAYGYCDQILDYLDQTDYDDVVFGNDRVTTEICRAKDLNRNYVSYLPDGYMDVVDFYTAQWSGSYYNDHHMLWLIQGNNIDEYLGPYKASFYSYYDSFLWFDIFVSDTFVLVE